MNALVKALPLAVFALAFATVAEQAPVAMGGGGCHGPSSPPEATGDTVLLQEHCFAPNVLRVAPGTTVSFRNNDMTEHHIAGVGMRWATNGMLREGQTASFTFEDSGTYPYTCYLHGGMSGAIVVGDGSFGAGQPEVSAAIAPSGSRVQASRGSSEPDPEPATPLAASAVTASSGGNNPLVYAGLGALIGAVTVALAVTARRFRPASRD